MKNMNQLIINLFYHFIFLLYLSISCINLAHRCFVGKFGHCPIILWRLPPLNPCIVRKPTPYGVGTTPAMDKSTDRGFSPVTQKCSKLMRSRKVRIQKNF